MAIALVAADARLRDDGGVLAVVIAMLAAAMATLVGFLIHEWGHLLGALYSGGVAVPASSWAAIFLFNFDVEKSSRAQFLAMSYGGYVGTAFAVCILALWIDLGHLSGMAALLFSTVGIGATLIVEIPVTMRVARGGAIPSGGVYAGTPK